MKRIVYAVVFLILAVPALASDPPPDQVARDVTDKILPLLRANKAEYNRDHQKLFAMVDEQVLPYFDFQAMSRTVLGRYWRQASADQRQRFTKEFRDLLVRTYATALLKYNNEQIVYLPFRMDAGSRIAMVRSEVRRTDGGPSIAINYSFYQTENGWKVYDLSVEGASLVTTYQSTYADRVRADGLDALVASLAQDNKAAAGKNARDDSKSGGPK